MKERERWRDERKTREINREIRRKEGKDEERGGRKEGWKWKREKT